jgi:hypothetical protein
VLNSQQCVNSTQELLKESLSSSTFPLPFTILGCVFFVACCLSKLQNSSTYLAGLFYALIGLDETGALIYLIYRYYNLGDTVWV